LAGIASGPSTDFSRQLLVDYIAFGNVWRTTTSCAQDATYAGSIKTALGAIERSEACVAMFLASVRFDSSGAVVRSVKTVSNRLVALRGAVRSFRFEHRDLPRWARECASTKSNLSSALRRTLKEWKVADMSRVPSRAAARKQAQLTEAHIEHLSTYTLVHTISGDMSLTQAQLAVNDALLLRIQAGCNNHHKHIASTRWSQCGWEATADGTGQQPYTEQVDLKALLLCGLNKALVMNPCVHMYIVDDITKHLFLLWWGWFHDVAGNDAYFFPKRTPSGFDFHHPLSCDDHSAACKRCAQFCELPLAQRDLALFTSTAVRRGVGGAATRVLCSALHGTNRETGRMEGSPMNSRTYTTETVWREPGPLYADVVRIRGVYAAGVEPALRAMMRRVMCKRCSVPNCTCSACPLVYARAHSKKTHMCWQRGKAGPTPTNGRWQSPETAAGIRKRWAELGVYTVPLFSSRRGEYVWASDEE
jgi:hypothetical protein